jgi:FhaA, N-terminal domain/FHA domain
MLARFERLMEQAVEGSLRRVFGTTLQPIQLAKAAARAMERAQVIGPRGPEAPNLYELYVSSADLARFGDYTHNVCAEIGSYLADYARDRGVRLIAEPRVELSEDASMRPGGVRARARFDGLPAPLQHEVDAAVEGTRQLRLADLAAARRQQQAAASPRRLRLRDASGLDLELDPEVEVVRIGRAADNDVVLASTNVSRYHAQLRSVESSWLVYDLTSTNGTWVDGHRLASGEPRLVRAGSKLRLGDHDMEIAVKARTPARRGRG